MWQAFPEKIVYPIIIITVIFSLIGAIGVKYAVNRKPLTTVDYLSSTIGAITFLSFLVWALGTHSAVVSFLWSAPLIGPVLNSFIPDINGSYDGLVKSNFKIKETNQLIDKPVVAKVKATILKVDLTVSPKDEKRNLSNTLSSFLMKGRDGAFQIWYIYENNIHLPNKEDVSYHFGSGHLKIIKDGGIILSGHYWTNRNWQNGTNTAGIIELLRVGD